MQPTSLAEALKAVVNDQGVRVLRDVTRLRVVLQARIGRSQDEAIDQLVEVLRTPAGQQMVGTGVAGGLDAAAWGAKITENSPVPLEAATEVAAMLLDVLASSERVELPGGIMILQGEGESAAGGIAPIRLPDTVAVVQIAYNVDGSLWAEGDSAMGLTLMSSKGRVWKVDVTSSNHKALSLQRIRRIAFDPSSQTIVLALSDRLAAFDVASGGEVWSFSPPNLFSFLVQGPSDAVFLNGAQLLVPFDEGSVNIWNLGGWSERRRRMSIAPRMIALLSDGSGFVGSDGSQTYVWDLPNLARRYRLTYERVYAVAALAQKPIVAARTLDQVHIFEAPTRKTLVTVDVDPGLPLLAASPTGDFFAIGAEYGASIIDTAGQTLCTLDTASGARLTALAFDPTGHTLAMGGIDGEVTFAPIGPPLPTKAL